MRDIQDKTDGTGDILTAAAFNTNLVNELQRIPESADFTLDVEAGPDTDTSMFIKSLVIYVGASNYYDDTGAVNTFVLDRAGNLEPWPEYKDGMTVLFKALNTNTGACTINIDSLGTKSLTTSAGAALSSGDITTNDYVTARYDAGNDRFEMVVAPVTGGGGALTSWEENANDLRPIVTKTGNLGDSTHLVEGAYFMDDGFVYFGDSQDASIRWYNSGTSFYFSSSAYMDFDVGTDLSIAVTGDFYIDNTGDFFINTNPAQDVYFQFSSTTHWQLSNAGPILPGGSNPSADIGSTTAEIENIYISDTGAVYFGSDQDMSINHDGSNGYINLSTGALRINGCDVSIDNLLAYQCENNVGTAFDMASIDGSNVAQIANTSLATNIQSSGTLTHNTVDFITSLLPAQATHSGEFLQTDGAGTLSWAAISALSAWEENGNDLRPVTTNVSDIGDTTHLLAHIYQTTGGYHYFGSSQDMYIYFSAAGYLTNTNGPMYIDTQTNLLFRTGGSNQWIIDTTGAFRPYATNTVDIGSSTLCINDIFFGDNGTINLGDAQDATILFDGTDLAITGTGDLLYNTYTVYNSNNFDIDDHLPAQATHSGEFLTTDGAGTLSWAAGFSLASWEENGDDLRPVVSGTGNLGDSTHLIEGAYFGDSGTIYLGTGQDMSIYHDGSDGYIYNGTGTLSIGTTATNAVNFYTSNVNRWLIDSNGHLTPNSAGSYNIGSATLEVNNIYLTDSGNIYFGSDQDMSIYHDGTDAYIDNNTGVINISDNGIVFDNDFGVSVKQSGGTVSEVLKMGVGDVFNIGTVDVPTNLRSNGTLYYNGITMASGTIDTTSSQTITVVDGLIQTIA